MLPHLRLCSFKVPVHCKSTALPILVLLSAMPGMTLSADWAFDNIHGFATLSRLRNGQVTFVRDAMDQQARTISYVADKDDIPISITRAYGPHGHKIIESENSALRHYVYGIGLSPIMRMESDGSITYQLGLDTLSVPASGSATLAHRVVDFKQSTVAAVDAQVPKQRASYTAFGVMRIEQAAATAYMEALLQAGYEELPPYILGSDQLVDNRARLYDPVSGRFLALDLAKQALAYEARGNDPVTRADVDGYVDFKPLLLAVQEDHKIPIVFGERHDSPFGAIALVNFAMALMNQGIKFRIFQENSLLHDQLAHAENNKDPDTNRLYIAGLRLLIGLGLVENLRSEDRKISESEKQRLNAAYSNMGELPVVVAGFHHWETHIPQILRKTGQQDIVTLFFVGSAHIFPVNKFVPENFDYPTKSLAIVSTGVRSSKVSLYLIPISSLDLQSKWNMVSVVPYDSSLGYAKHASSYYFFEQLSPSLTSLGYSICIPFNVFHNHQALGKQYSGAFPLPAYFLKQKDADDEKNESDEKTDELHADQHKESSLWPVKKPGGGNFSKEKFYEK